MIRTRGLSYRYATDGTAPLRFPDVDLRQGGTLLLRGRSGSGKSTWLSLIAGLVARKATQRIARDRAAIDRRELCRSSLGAAHDP